MVHLPARHVWLTFRVTYKDRTLFSRALEVMGFIGKSSLAPKISVAQQVRLVNYSNLPRGHIQRWEHFFGITQRHSACNLVGALRALNFPEILAEGKGVRKRPAHGAANGEAPESSLTGSGRCCKRKLSPRWVSLCQSTLVILLVNTLRYSVGR